jgi:hypothetical protein
LHSCLGNTCAGNRFKEINIGHSKLIQRSILKEVNMY